MEKKELLQRTEAWFQIGFRRGARLADKFVTHEEASKHLTDAERNRMLDIINKYTDSHRELLQRMAEALKESNTHIKHLHDIFNRTVTGESVIKINNQLLYDYEKLK